MIPPLAFTQDESLHANKHFGANCGPHALAAASGKSILIALQAIPDFIKKGYTNPTMMVAGIKALNLQTVLSKNLRVKGVPIRGVSRIQWEGRWTRSGAPPIAAYPYTHWIGSADDHVFCTACSTFGWVPYAEWAKDIDALCLRNNYDGWHVTHQYLFL
jgi:hypothetical protein